MLYIETDSKDAAFHFSVEEYIVRHYPFNEPVMMIWQADNCVMLGCNQIAEAEVDMGYVKKTGMQVVRRSSGGGTIFTDMGTLLFSLIFPETDEMYPLEIAKNKVAAPIAEALNKMGIPAKIEGRNDILVDGKKVSGLALYVRHGRVCTHGSLLYDADLEKLAHVLRVDEEKIRSKALRSVRSRVTNVKEHMNQPFSTREFWERLKQLLFNNFQFRECTLTGHDLAQIEQIHINRYGNPAWTFEQAPKFSFQNSKRFAGGKVEIHLDIVNGIVSSCSIKGDFLGVIPIHNLEKQFENVKFQHSAFGNALSGILLQPYLGNITKDEFMSCIFD